ncbi:tRNA methyltransferase complex GCD14 subunit [Marasmius fiardii PR-910]|nr:tRNA methyltransferase complex GCD14 subunit [Marasmius fiardii PR-910]
MWSTKREIEAGDTVILWLTRDNLLPLTISSDSNAVFNSKFGSYPHSSLIGLPYGSKVPSRKGNGFIHVLRPTPELWTLALPHRTQILYAADISFITGMLSIRKGSNVVEAGTGSGSFSHAVMRTVGPTGHLWSYEFHEARQTKAREEFIRHGFLPSRVTLTHRNVCKDGFTVEDTADALFLDLPAPWEAIEHAKKALKKDRTTRICCFSPCMEQVMRTVSALNDSGFTEITMYETLIRPFEVSSSPPLTSIVDVGEKIKQSEARREEKRLKQIAQGHRGEMEAKRLRTTEDVEENSDPSSTLRQRLGEEGAGVMVVAEPNQEQEDVEMTFSYSEANVSGSTPKSEKEMNKKPQLQQRRKNLVGGPGAVTLSRVMPQVRGHTSYLTFACLLPLLSTGTGSEEVSGSEIDQDLGATS